jgi:hypothetical protein
MLLNGLLLPSIGRVHVCPISISVEADVFLFPLATQSLGPTSLESLIQTSQPQTSGGRNCAEHLVCTLAALTRDNVFKTQRTIDDKNALSPFPTWPDLTMRTSESAWRPRRACSVAKIATRSDLFLIENWKGDGIEITFRHC